MYVKFCTNNERRARETVAIEARSAFNPLRQSSVIRMPTHLRKKTQKTQNQNPRRTRPGVFKRMINFFYRTCVALTLYFFTSIAACVQAADWPSEVVASYDISFAGFSVGSFDFRSTVNEHHYVLAGEANISAVFGAFEWRGLTRSDGVIIEKKPDPKSYAFDYQSSSNNGSVRLDFMMGHIIRSDISPYQPYTNQYVPLLSQHMRDVYDPVSAIMALTRSTPGHPCKRRIPIFDGRQRFDLVLSPMGTTQISEARPSGQPEDAYICKVMYVPLGGYIPNSQTQYMQNNSGMRIVLRKVPSANIYIPYQIRIPTIAGEALLSSRKVNIITAKRQRIALVH